MRRGFSLIELVISLVLVSLFAMVAMGYLSEEPEKALVARAKHELKSMQKQVQANALKAHNYHFSTLEEALGRSEPLLDPWGHPYILMHGTYGYTYRPEVDYWVNGKADALYSSSTMGESGEAMLDHWIISAGPNKAFLRGEEVGPEGAKLDDLKVKVRLGKPKIGGDEAPQTGPRLLRVDKTTIYVKLFDHANEDGDLVEVRVNSSTQVPTFKIMHVPRTYPLTLTSATNVVEVYAHNEGTGSPNTVTAEFSDVVEGDPVQRWGLKTSESGVVHITAP